MDTVEVTLPISKSVVSLRNYTTRKDDLKAEAVLYAGVSAKQEVGQNAGLEFPLSNVMASNEVYVQRLVISIDGDTSNLIQKLEDLRSEDYEEIDKAVTQIVEEHSPKAKEAKKASETATNAN